MMIPNWFSSTIRPRPRAVMAPCPSSQLDVWTLSLAQETSCHTSGDSSRTAKTTCLTRMPGLTSSTRTTPPTRIHCPKLIHLSFNSKTGMRTGPLISLTPSSAPSTHVRPSPTTSRDHHGCELKALTKSKPQNVPLNESGTMEKTEFRGTKSNSFIFKRTFAINQSIYLFVLFIQFQFILWALAFISFCIFNC